MNAECVYSLVASPGNAMSVNVVFELKPSENCAEQYIEVRENDGAGAFIDAFCGAGERNAVVNGTAWIKFKSNNETAYLGFVLKFNYGETKGLCSSH